MRFIDREAVGSTQDEVRRLYEAGERGPLCFRADIQLSGRGRLNRRWASAKGNLFATMLYPTETPAQSAALYGFATAVAMARTIAEFGPTRVINLKWPNDVLVGGAKISGILIEREPEALLIGTGLNLISHPENTPYPATNLLEVTYTQAPVGPSLAGRVLAEQMMAAFKSLESQGFEPIREAWLSLAYRLGETVRVGDVEGIFEDLGLDGALCLRLEDGTRREIHTGDVSFG